MHVLLPALPRGGPAQYDDSVKLFQQGKKKKKEKHVTAKPSHHKTDSSHLNKKVGCSSVHSKKQCVQPL